MCFFRKNMPNQPLLDTYSEVAKIEVFEVWCWIKMLKIPWTEKVKTFEVFRIMNT